MPERIQRRRTRGWRMPPGAVYVGRPSRWRNQYKVTRSERTRALLVVQYSKHGHPDGTRWAGFTDTHEATVFAVNLYRRMVLAALDRDPVVRNTYLDALIGCNLACWCALDAPCHADVLLELANRERIP